VPISSTARRTGVASLEQRDASRNPGSKKFIIKRLLLGLVLILLASAVLLISDWRRRDSSADGAGANKKWVVNLLEYVNVEDSEESEKGIMKDSGKPAWWRARF
jgi:hypothetical protein